VAEHGKLPVPNFSAGGIATPADAALVMQLGAEAVFVGSGIFKSSDPEARARAIVKAATYYNDPAKLARSERRAWVRPCSESISRSCPNRNCCKPEAGRWPAWSQKEARRRAGAAGRFRGAWKRALERAGAEAVEVRSAPRSLKERARIDNSGRRKHHHVKLLEEEKLLDPLREFGRRRPIFGTCAGAILLATEVANPPQASLGLMDIDVERNAYGRQLDSRIARLAAARYGRRSGSGVHPRSDYSARGRGRPRSWRSYRRRSGVGGARPASGGDFSSGAHRATTRVHLIFLENPLVKVLQPCASR
jgi:hypothetical protein